jgi:hypothetical protein
LDLEKLPKGIVISQRTFSIGELSKTDDYSGVSLAFIPVLANFTLISTNTWEAKRVSILQDIDKEEERLKLLKVKPMSIAICVSDVIPSKDIDNN